MVRIFPGKDSASRLVGALLAERHEEWSTSSRYLKIDEFDDWLYSHSDKEATDVQYELANRTLQPA
ncbi:transposase [Salinibacter ruber]|uniref:transposase n=1 Tax=Salinibacter ruber TaxID=146919 RepID=UPI003C6E1A2A